MTATWIRDDLAQILPLTQLMRYLQGQYYHLMTMIIIVMTVEIAMIKTLDHTNMQLTADASLLEAHEE